MTVSPELPADDLGAPSMAAACEAVLLLVDEPLEAVRLAQILRRPVPLVTEVLRDLAADYAEQKRGFELREAGGGWRFYTSAECADVVARYVTDGQPARLSQAALETLAIIAYRQPISRGRISAVRGVNVDGVVRTLLTRGLVEEAGVEPEGSAVTLRTSRLFLERLGIANLSELPPVAAHVPTYSAIGDLVDQV